MMMQVKLLQIADGLEPGQAITISRNDMAEAAEGERRSLILDGPVREDDIKAFEKKAGDNWRVDFRENVEAGDWTMYKPAHKAQEGCR